MTLHNARTDVRVYLGCAERYIREKLFDLAEGQLLVVQVSELLEAAKRRFKSMDDIDVLNTLEERLSESGEFSVSVIAYEELEIVKLPQRETFLPEYEPDEI